MTQPSRLDAPEIRAVLEANRAKLAMMQAQQQAQTQQRAATTADGPSTYAPVTDTPAVGLPRPGGPSAAPPDVGATAAAAGRLRSNPMFGEEAAATPGPATSAEYAPKFAGAMRTPPIAGLSSDAQLPPLGDLFLPQPSLPLGLDLGSPLPAGPRTPGLPLPPSSSTDSDPIPALPPWDAARPYLTGRFLFDAAADVAAGRAGTAPPQPLESYPPQVQESMLVNDLLHAFGGLEGTWVRPKVVDGRAGPRLEFRIAARGQLEPALLEMATRMLPLAECVAVASRFAETRRRPEWGLVAQALAGGVRGVLQDWDLMLAQLETQWQGGKLTLQALWYYVQPPMSALRLVATIAAEASSRRLRGAELLSLLHAKAGALLGDAAAHRLALRLLRAAAEPYFAMLQRWLADGLVDDPYAEFMVQEDKSIKKDDLSADGGAAFWAERLTLRRAMDPLTGAPALRAVDADINGINNSTSASGGPVYDVPVFLERVARQILDTGRCIDLVRSCGQSYESPLPAGTRLEYDESGRFVAAIEAAHRGASAAALALMRHEVGVARGLAALRRYFLAAQGDLFLGLMESGAADLAANCAAVPLTQLQSVLDLAVRASSAAADPAAARLKAAYDHRSVLNLLIAITQTAGPAGPADSPAKRPKLRPVVPAPMTAAERSTVGRQRRARESFMLSYEVPWPLAVVVPDAALAQYQMIFRHLFELKWVEHELNRVCSLYQTTRPLAVMQRRAAGVGGGRRRSLAGDASAAAQAEALAAAGPPPASAVALARAVRTCQLMTHFFRQYLLYATFEVLEPLWRALEGHIAAAGSVDEIIDLHRAFLRRVMKGLLLSRKVVVLRALLSLKQLALEFVALSCRHVDLDIAEAEAAAEAAAEGSSGGGGGGSGGASAAARAALRRERRLEREARVRAALDEALSNPEFSQGVKELRVKFEARCGDFMSALGEAHRQARSERTDTREELEGLLNLMGRLDFNGYFERAGLVTPETAAAEAAQ